MVLFDLVTDQDATSYGARTPHVYIATLLITDIYPSSLTSTKKNGSLSEALIDPSNPNLISFNTWIKLALDILLSASVCLLDWNAKSLDISYWNSSIQLCVRYMWNAWVSSPSLGISWVYRKSSQEKRTRKFSSSTSDRKFYEKSNFTSIPSSLSWLPSLE